MKLKVKNHKKTGTFSRRKILHALSLIAGVPVLSPAGFALSEKDPLAKYKLHSFELRVSDVARSVILQTFHPIMPSLTLVLIPSLAQNFRHTKVLIHQ